MPMQNNNAPDYIAREKAILRKMHETGYAMFDGDRDEAMDFMSSNLARFTDYANVIIREQTMLPMWNMRYEGDDLKDKITQIDKERRMKHNCAIDSVNVLNRMSKNLGLEPFAEIDTNDRHNVADFCGQFVNQVYNKGIGNTMYDAVKDRNMEYDTTQHSREIRVPEYLQDQPTDNTPQFGG